MRKTLIVISLSFFTFGMGQAQQIFSTNKYPLVDFRPPLDITPPALAGSFGEIRANHFHSGMDFRTNQREGYPVYAIADGYISRIRIQNSGFGNALYINHPNGFTSVYGHLQRYNGKLTTVAKGIQYSKKSFEIDEFPGVDVIPVHKGDVIAYSGNTGSSGGPHLHFEVRDTKTEATINPQLFGITIPDNIAPVISGLFVYKLNGAPFNEFTKKQALPLSGAGGKYILSKTVTLGGEVGFGIIATDRHTGLSGLNGVYAIVLEVDGKTVFTSALERFMFENSKAINSHIDYPEYMNTRRSIQKSFVDPGNPLQIYSSLVNNGRISFTDGKTHDIQYTVTDVKGNKSTINFTVQAESNSAVTASSSPEGTILFPYNKPNTYATDNVKIVVPVGSLYNDLYLSYKEIPKPTALSADHKVQNGLTPLHIGFELWIKPNHDLGALAGKALIVSANGGSQGGSFSDGYVKGIPRNFGTFRIAVDTTAPIIVPVNITEGKSMKGLGKMTFKIRDNLSGIKNFNGFIDGRWVLMEFDAKTATLWHSFDELTTPGKHVIE
ncbi:MAG: M23 family metallopeptidase, partial [Pedobacter sp.]